MLYKNEESFSKAFKGSEPEGIYFLYGSENYLIGAWAKKIAKRVCGEGSAFDLQQLDGRKPDVELLYDATEALPLMTGKKCVLLDDLDISKLNSEQQKSLEELLKDLNPMCVLVITGKTPLFDPNSAAGKKLVKTVGENGTAVELGSRGTAGLTAFLKSLAKKNGCEASTEVCKYILQICDNDMNSLTAETAKICAYAGGGEITRVHVDAVATPKIEARVFDLSKAILAGNLQRAMELLANLFYLRETPVAILSVLSMAYVDLYRARAARDEGRSMQEVMRMFGYKSEYRVKNAFNSRLSADELRECLKYLYECDIRIKSSGLDGRVLLEQTVTRLSAAGR